MDEDRSLALRCAPLLRFDTAEPFLPIRIGFTVLHADADSPSFKRKLTVPRGGLIVEYAIYWDWDIQHLYDLEHVWIYLDPSLAIVDAEASFHGRYLKSLLPDRSNFVDGRLVLYSQPGKHAFSPLPIIFELLPDYLSATGSGAGVAGALVTSVLDGRVSKTATDDKAAATWLKRQAFNPTGMWRDWLMDAGMLRNWKELDAELPVRFERKLAELRHVQ